MKLDSIIFECPFIYRGNISSTTQTIVAHSIDQYLKLNSPTHDKIFLITVEFNNKLFVIKELNKIHKLNTSFNKLSEFLNEKIVVLEIINNNGQMSTNIVYETKNSSISI